MPEPSELLLSLRGGGAQTDAEDVDATPELDTPAVATPAEAPEETPAAEPTTPAAPFTLTLPIDLLPSEIPDGFEQMLSSATDALAAGGVDQSIAQRLVNLYADTAIELDFKGDPADRFAEYDCVTVLQREWKDDYAQNLTRAKDAANRLGDAFKRWLDDTRLGNSPAMLVALARYGAGAITYTPEAAKAKLTAMMSDPSFAKATSNSAGKRRAAEMRTLGRIANEGAKSEQPKSSAVLTGAKPASAGESTKASARQEAAKMVNDRNGALMLKSHPDHAQAVKRFHELTCIL